MKPFTTSFGTVIPGLVMAKVAEQLAADADWQDVSTRLLRPLISEHEDDLGECNEVLAEAELRAGLS